MEIKLAGAPDIGDIADLLWRFSEHDERAGSKGAFASELHDWWIAHHDSHVPFLALLRSHHAVGMAWLAIIARVPRPGGMHRLCGDIQSVFVVPGYRSSGVGTALTRAVLQHADDLGLEHVTVHSSQQAASMYERAGFASYREVLMRTPQVRERDR